jgi:hypothetical protein
MKAAALTLGARSVNATAKILHRIFDCAIFSKENVRLRYVVTKLSQTTFVF